VNSASNKKSHYWLRRDFDNLMGLLPGAEIALPNGNRLGHTLQYPKHVEGAIAELKLRGLECDAATLESLVAEGVVNPERMPESDGIKMWSKDDIDAAAEYLYDHDKWSPWTAFCFVSNIRFGQAVKAYRVAAARYNLGFTLNFDLPGLVTVIEPGDSPDDYAWITFYPGDTKLRPREAN
jgi:hypothetical protein